MPLLWPLARLYSPLGVPVRRTSEVVSCKVFNHDRFIAPCCVILTISQYGM